MSLHQNHFSPIMHFLHGDSGALTTVHLLRSDLLRLDYISCILTVLSTLLVGKRLWHGWILATLNSIVVCIIGLKTRQIGFIPANIFCIVLYAVNVRNWLKAAESPVHSGAGVDPRLSLK